MFSLIRWKNSPCIAPMLALYALSYATQHSVPLSYAGRHSDGSGICTRALEKKQPLCLRVMERDDIPRSAFVTVVFCTASSLRGVVPFIALHGTGCLNPWAVKCLRMWVVPLGAGPGWKAVIIVAGQITLERYSWVSWSTGSVACSVPGLFCFI